MKINLKKFNSTGFSGIETLVLVVVVGIISGIGYSVWQRSANTNPDTQAESKSVADFSRFYPNTGMYKTKYLNGNNYVTTPASWAVLWFGDIKSTGQYKMYNSNPAGSDARCNWDQFAWTRTSLQYSRTRNTCGTTNSDIQYSPAIAYLPRTWDGKAFKKSGTSVATYFESGRLKCAGTNSWIAEISADPVELSSGVMATHVRSTQTTSWSSGPGSKTTGCKPGEKSRYQENLYFVTDLPIYGSQNVAPGLKRSVGGSLDFYAQRGWDWDIWFDNWKQLP